MSQEVILALQVLLTGFVVVCAVLFLLIAIRKIYGTIVYNIETGAKKSKKEKTEQNSKATSVVQPPINAVPLKPQVQNDGIEEEIVAVIAAAVAAMYGSENKVKIKSISKSPASRSNWAMAGILDNTKPF